MFTGDFAAEPVDIVVVALNLDHVGLINQIAENLGRFEIGRDEHITLHPAAAAWAATGWPDCRLGAGDRFKTEFPRAGGATETTRSLNDRVG